VITTTQIINNKVNQNIIKISRQPEPPNLEFLKDTIKSYVEDGSYQKDIEKVISQAEEHIKNTHNKVKNPAVVLDIDETSLSNLEYFYKYDFGGDQASWIEWIKKAEAKAIKPVLELYKLCKSLNISIFFITGRKQLSEDINQDPTIINLKKEGYEDWKKVYFKPFNTQKSTIEYKTECREDIEKQGYTIIANIGDQYSDLIGGYSQKTFKLPNPFYYIP